ncbi:MAG: magnesium transporter [Clostridiales Family XIII bacterium]|jgi:magnesium transporter|nr:magnesium transporter [Clostridiales Family XIII bacterium]
MEQIKNFISIRDEVITLLENKKYLKARSELMNLNEVDIAEILEEAIEQLGINMAIILFRMLPKDTAVEVFSHLPSDDQVTIIDAITDKETEFIISELDFDDMIDVMEELPANIVDKILTKTSKAERHRINTFLKYPEDTAGSLMTPDYITLARGMTVKQALAHIKKEGMDSETVYTCYIKDAGRRLMGIVSLRNLVTSDDDDLIDDMMVDNPVYVHVNDNQEDVSEVFKRYNFLAMPVVDREHRLVGIITADDMLDVIEEETTEDFERMGGIIDSGEQEYFDTPVFKHVWNRLPWLILLMVAAMVTGAVIGHFESLLANVTVLAVYMPMLMGTGGNSGSQAATLIIRGMAVGDIELRDFPKVLFKEFRVGIIIGIALSLFNVLRLHFIDHKSLGLIITVCFALLFIVVIAKCIGSMLPMLAKRIGIDPALMAAPMISSLTDMFSCLVYFSLANLVLSYFGGI